MGWQSAITKPSASQKPVRDVYVAIDACAELAGQPYTVLESLKKVYEITKKRNLYVIDTEQGFHEKSDCTVPAFISALNKPNNSYIGFLQRNQEWTKIISTPKCTKFRKDLATQIIPDLILPIIKLSEDATIRIQQEAFRLLKESGHDTIDGKRISKPSDIEIKIEENEITKNSAFTGELINKAANAVMPFWKEKIDKIASLGEINKKSYKGFMAEMMKATQETKAFSYAFFKAYSPDQLPEINNLPNIDDAISLNSVTPKDLKKLSETSYIFSDTRLRSDEKWWEKSEALQALRLTKLWPWSLKQNLTENMKDKLNSCHKNTADMSYLKLYTDILPKLSPPEKTLFIIVTNDSPLINQFLETSTGLSKVFAREKYDEQSNKQPKKVTTYVQSAIYDKLDLAKRNPNDYPRQSALVGSEFVRFVYQEVLDSISTHIKPEEMRYLLRAVKNNRIDANKSGDAYNILKHLLEKAEYIPPKLDTALLDLLEKTHIMEKYISRDIQSNGIVAREGRYDDRRALLLQKRNETNLCL